MRRSTIVALLAILAILAACSQAASPSAEPTPTEEPTPTATEEPTDEPSESALPSFDEGAGDLADVLPEEVGGITLQYQSSQGASVFGSEAMTPEAQAFFDRVGADPSQLSSAFGFGLDATAGSVISIVAFRITGADEGQLRDEFRASIEAEGNVVSEQTVGGKDVFAFGTEGADASGYFHVSGDTIFIVAGEPVALAEEALAALP